MMQRFSTTRFRNRPWLLLWLLPFVLLNFAGEALHNHPIFSDDELAPRISARAPHSDLGSEVPREDARADMVCLACQWHAFSAGHLAAQVAFFAPLRLAPSRVLAHIVPRTLVAATPLNRGPPLSFA